MYRISETKTRQKKKRNPEERELVHLPFRYINGWIHLALSAERTQSTSKQRYKATEKKGNVIKNVLC